MLFLAVNLIMINLKRTMLIILGICMGKKERKMIIRLGVVSRYYNFHSLDKGNIMDVHLRFLERII